MSCCRFAVIAGLLVGASGLATVIPAEAAAGPLARTNEGSRLYMITPAMMHAIDVIVAEKMKMMHRRR